MGQFHQILTFAITISTVTVLAFSIIPMTTANAITDGETVTILMRSDDIPAPPNTLQDGLRFTGKPATFVDTTDCQVEGTHPIQQAALVDLNGQSGRVNVIVLSQTDPIPAGTELTNLTSAITICTLDGVVYERFTGEAGTPGQPDNP